MKKRRLIMIMAAIVFTAWGEEISTSPVNPEFLKQTEQRENGILVTKTEEGYSPGYTYPILSKLHTPDMRILLLRRACSGSVQHGLQPDRELHT